MSQKSYQKGYTLIETIVVVALFALIMVVTYATIWQFYRTNSYTIEQSAAVSSGRNGVMEMVQDLREATASDGGSYPLIDIDEYEIEFFSDIDRDDFVERAHYYVDDNKRFIRDTIDPSGDPPIYTGQPNTTVIAEHVQNIEQSKPIFEFFDVEGAEINPNTGNISDVRFIRVNLIVNVDTRRQPDEFSIHSSALLRNLIFVIE